MNIKKNFKSIYSKVDKFRFEFGQKNVVKMQMDIQCKCICKLCGKPLVKIGNARKNGANHSDWGSRKYHKKCTFEGKALDVKKM